MGYPMTFRRVVNRNGLQEGGYGDLPRGLGKINLDMDIFKDTDIGKFAGQHIKSLESSWGLVLGDLRRLEFDAVDERAIATYISTKTGIDVELVAVVLKEFMEW